jgi:hypothetical protein
MPVNHGGRVGLVRVEQDRLGLGLSHDAQLFVFSQPQYAGCWPSWAKILHPTLNSSAGSDSHGRRLTSRSSACPGRCTANVSVRVPGAPRGIVRASRESRTGLRTAGSTWASQRYPVVAVSGNVTTTSSPTRTVRSDPASSWVSACLSASPAALARRRTA